MDWSYSNRKQHSQNVQLSWQKTKWSIHEHKKNTDLYKYNNNNYAKTFSPELNARENKGKGIQRKVWEKKNWWEGFKSKRRK